ncbi:MAG: NAD(P)-dependent oxidoreductase [Bdellovibrionota bacterium]
MTDLTKKNILICERFAFEAEIALKQNKNFNVQNYSEEKLATATALIIRSKFLITPELLDKAPNLELIVTCTSGFDHINLIETQKRKICVMFTPDANATAASELTWTLLMTSNRQTLAAHQELKSGDWNREAYFMSPELTNKTIGIIGLGRIGSLVAKYAKAFNMNVLAFDPYVAASAFTDTQATRASYEEVLKQADFLSFHVPFTNETKNMFNRSHLEFVNPDLILINTSRGGVVNEDDLIQALNDKKIKFAALDVFSKEPLTKESKLLKCKNIILTPHLGAYTEEAFLKASLEANKRVSEFFENNKTLNTLPIQNDWGSLSFSERS